MRNILFGRRPAASLVPGWHGEVLVLSMRRVADLPAHCVQYEFEDVMCAVTGADRVEPLHDGPAVFRRRAYKAWYGAGGSAHLARRLTPEWADPVLRKRYRLLVAVFNTPSDLYALAAVPRWRAFCDQAVCFIAEAWEQTLEQALPPPLRPSMREFDRVYLGANPIEALAGLTGVPCEYLPLGVDAVAMSPLPDCPTRAIDVLGIGRRSEVTHGALLDLARERGWFYYYDSIRSRSASKADITFAVTDVGEHRFKLASLLRRSRYSIANRARANVTGFAEVDELSSRFFEGAAAGAVLLGDPPVSGPFLSLFDWPDAVVPVPIDSPDIAGVIDELEADPLRRERIRRENMVQSLLRHDWVYRVRRILTDAGLALPQALLGRERQLQEMAAQVRTLPFAD